jgi:16S rRNA (cytosine967-C5)-methyltransferase
VVRRVFEHGAYADRALHSEAAVLDARDRRLATAISYGTIQRRATLDHVAGRLASRPLDRLDPPVLAALRLGLFQLLFLDGVADHAAVNESVELAKPSGASLVNAILRRAAREGRAIVEDLDDSSPERAAILHSVPQWLAEQWWAELGADEARSLLAHLNAPAESVVRVNTLRADPAEVLGELGVPAHPAPDLPEGIVIDAPFDAHGSQLFADGAIMPQSRGSMRVAHVVAPVPGERILDLCAAPGGKTTHLGALISNRGEVVAVERHHGRAAALRETCQRMGTTCVRVEIGDAAGSRNGLVFDRVLVDPPCSGLGTLQSRPDLRWRMTPADIDALAAIQRRILDAAATATAPGGRLVYSVCTISSRETGEVITDFLGAHPQFSAERQLQLLPDRDRTDGFFIAELRRS